MGKKFKLEFDGLSEMVERLEKLNGDLKTTTENALKATFSVVTPNIQNAINASQYNFNRTGQTKRSLVKMPAIEWDGMVASVPIGFDIGGGGLASIFLMYGTPSIQPDRGLYTAIYGAKTQKQVAQIQREVFEKRIARLQK